ncbi:MAG: hypothetical protein Kow0027_06320 [Saprospiraceae bacterium]
MTPVAHRIYRTSLISIVVIVTVYLAYTGLSYYTTPIEERFYHPQHDWFKPSGLFGHGLGIIGTLLILIGVVMYIVRKRSKMMARWGRLKYWLEFHIFLCTLGPVMVLFHTAFKFGGIVSVAFWSMVAVVASGVVGRFIYVRIPRSIEGRALSLNEVKEMKGDVERMLKGAYGINEEDFQRLVAITESQKQSDSGYLQKFFGGFFAERKILAEARSILKSNNMAPDSVNKALGLIKKELTLNNRIENLQLMHKLFRYWHVAHLPFALIMLIIVIIHVIVTITFGAHWIFE